MRTTIGRIVRDRRTRSGQRYVRLNQRGGRGGGGGAGGAGG